MESRKVLDLVNEIEQEFPIHEWTIDGICVWPLIRIRLYFEAFYTFEAQKPGNEAKRRLGRLTGPLQGWQQAKQAYKSDPASKKPLAASAIHFGNGTLECLEGKQYDRIGGPFLDRLSVAGSICYWAPQHRYEVPRAHQTNFLQYKLDLAALSTILKSSPPSLPWSEQLSKAAAKFTDAGAPTVAPTVSKTWRNWTLIQAYRNVLGKELKNQEVKLALRTCYYDNIGHGLMLAARDLKIPTIDLQHGLVSSNHVSYCRWENVPSKGYDLLPTHFWLWSDGDAELMSQLGNSGHELLVGGNLFIQDWIEKERGKDFRVAEKAGPIVLYCGNGVTDEGPLVAEIAQELKKQNPSAKLWFRMHPSYRKLISDYASQFQSKGLSNIELTTANDIPLLACLEQSDVHLTEFSSTAIEAESFGVPTVFVSARGAETFPKIVERGWGVYESSPMDIATASLKFAEDAEAFKGKAKQLQTSGEAAISKLISLAR